MKAALSLIYQQLLKQIPLDHTRFLFDQFHLKDRLTGLVGPRGSGKTTLLLQYIKQNLPVDETFYFSADHIYFTQITLYEFVMQLHLEDGVQTVFIDEIHKYKQWNQELKNVYDSFPKLTIAFSGSSSLDLVKGSYDLSRRAKLFRLPGMSFREYMQLTSKTSYPILTWDELLQSPQKAYERIGDVPRVMSHFKDYLRHGFYPFYYEQPLSYHEKLLAVLDKTIFEDIAEFYHLKTPHLSLLRKLVAYLATVPPGTVSTHNLAKNMQVDDKTVLGFLMQLQETGLVRMVYPAEPGRAQLTRPAKIFLSNVNMQYALEANINTPISLGTVRELFFVQALQDAAIPIFHSKIGDYEVNGIVFEVGGQSKTGKQIQSAEQAFLVKDDIYAPTRRDIPLWLFGFLY